MVSLFCAWLWLYLIDAHTLAFDLQLSTAIGKFAWLQKYLHCIKVRSVEEVDAQSVQRVLIQTAAPLLAMQATRLGRPPGSTGPLQQEAAPPLPPGSGAPDRGTGRRVTPVGGGEGAGELSADEAGPRLADRVQGGGAAGVEPATTIRTVGGGGSRAVPAARRRRAAAPKSRAAVIQQQVEWCGRACWQLLARLGRRAARRIWLQLKAWLASVKASRAVWCAGLSGIAFAPIVALQFSTLHCSYEEISPRVWTSVLVRVSLQQPPNSNASSFSSFSIVTFRRVAST